MNFVMIPSSGSPDPSQKYTPSMTLTSLKVIHVFPPGNADEASGEQGSMLSEPQVSSVSLSNISFVPPKRMVGNPAALCQVAVSIDGEDCTGEVNN